MLSALCTDRAYMLSALWTDRADMLSAQWNDRACSLGKIDPQSREPGGLVMETLALMSGMTAAGSSKSQLLANIHCIRMATIINS